VNKFNCSPKLGSEFIVPTRNDLLPIIHEISLEIVDTVIGTYELILKLGTHLGKRFRVHVSHVENPLIVRNELDANGVYDSEDDERGKIPISLYLITNPFNTTLLWDQETFDRVAKRIADCLIHELTHLHQARAREFLNVSAHHTGQETDEEEAQSYLSEFDEIDAYAHNIAEELLELDGAVEIHRCLEHPSDVSLNISPNLWGYINTFKKDLNHPVIKRLLKKIYKNYQILAKKDLRS
jgi:hypothetical protein